MTSLFIPGWATTSDLFKTKTPFPKLTPSIQKDLDSYLATQTQKFTLIGFSMGAILAAEAAAKHPNKIKSTILIGLRPHYNKEEITPLKANLQKNKALTLKKFYQAAIHEPKDWQNFKTQHLATQTNAYTTETLLSLLDLLSTLKITSKQLQKTPNLQIHHAIHDKIAPITEIKPLFPSLKHHKTGHIPNLDLYTNIVHTA